DGGEDQRVDRRAVVEEAEADAAVAAEQQAEEGRQHELAVGRRAGEQGEDGGLARLIGDGDGDGDRQPAAQHHPPPPTTAAQRRHSSSCTSGRTRQQRSQRAPSARPTRTPTPGTSGRVKASSGGGPTRSVAAEVMHSSARSTSPTGAGAKISTAACRLEPMRLAARSSSSAPVATRRSSRSRSQRAAKS